jgi:hypothetical protein
MESTRGNVRIEEGEALLASAAAPPLHCCIIKVLTLTLALLLIKSPPQHTFQPASTTTSKNTVRTLRVLLLQLVGNKNPSR